MIYRLLVILLIASLAVAVGGIVYFGIGPMLIKPASSPTAVQDASTALGLDGQTDSSPAVGGLKPITADAQTMTALLQRLGQHLQLPPHVVPEIHQVVHASDLPELDFFAQAQDQDLMLTFPTQDVVLYRPTSDQVIATGRTSTDQDQP